MGVMMYKADEHPVRIEHTEMAGYESMGWSIHENLAGVAEVFDQMPERTEPTETQDDTALRELAVAEYEAKFGEKPHHRMKLDTILEKLNGNEPVQS